MRAITSMTWMEILRKQVLLVTLLLTVLFLSVFTYTTAHISTRVAQLATEGLLVTYTYSMYYLSTGLFFASFVVSYLVIFSAVGTISSEVESGLLLAILPRPVHRWEVYFGKWIAFIVWGLAYSAILFWSLVGIIEWQFQFSFDVLSLWKAFALFAMIPVVLINLTLLGSTFLPTLGNGVGMVLLFSLGLLGGLLTRLFHTEEALQKVELLTSLLIPTDALYRRMTFELMGGEDTFLLAKKVSMISSITGSNVPSNAFLWYSVCYMLIIMLIGYRSFKRKDL